MAAPNYQATGTMVNGTTGIVTPSWPTHASGDVAFLIVESAGPNNITLTTASGFQPLTYGLGTAQSGGTRLTVWWCRATSASMAAPSVQSAANHIAAAIVTVRGAYANGDPVEVFGYTNKSSASTSVTWPAVTTVTDDCLILNIGTRDNDASGAALSSAANASLSSVAEGLDDGTTQGNGGGAFTVSGVLATAGSSGSTTATVTSSQNMLLTLGIRSQVPSSGIYMRQRTLGNIYTGASSIALPANTLAGSLIVVDVSQYNANPVATDFSDSQVNSYSAVTAAVNDGGVNRLFMAYAKNIVGGAFTLNVTGNSLNGSIQVTEYVGADTTAPLDQVSTASATSSTYTASVTTTTDDELYHVIATDDGDDFSIFTPATNYKAGIQQGDITNWMRLGTADRITTQGTISGGFTVPASVPYALILASFKPGTGAAASSNGFFNFF